MFYTTEDLTHILIFKTNIGTDHEKVRVKELFLTIQGVEDVNVDMEDVDKVLRIVSREHKASDIINLIKQQGFFCEELE